MRDPVSAIIFRAIFSFAYASYFAHVLGILRVVASCRRWVAAQTPCLPRQRTRLRDSAIAATSSGWRPAASKSGHSAMKLLDGLMGSPALGLRGSCCSGSDATATAGCCWVMQCMRAEAPDQVAGIDATISRSGKSSARMLSAMRSLGSLNTGTSTTPLAM